MFQLSRVAYQSLSHGLATGRVKVPQISKFNNTLKEDVKGLSKELSEDSKKLEQSWICMLSTFRSRKLIESILDSKVDAVIGRGSGQLSYTKLDNIHGSHLTGAGGRRKFKVY
ncbi:hypothetical protein RhiirA4_429356 [Rhizophagus irregularis]|uniref:Uncharacterized protein n=1 Tax=Rhizophagus irregularis TaxID=588596 RepID=A0A2I1HGE1_9GLOM|nr:hypothetical protein RhiirA4_429356 [Rhizophagus irregularis]